MSESFGLDMFPREQEMAMGAAAANPAQEMIDPNIAFRQHILIGVAVFLVLVLIWKLRKPIFRTLEKMTVCALANALKLIRMSAHKTHQFTDKVKKAADEL